MNALIAAATGAAIALAAIWAAVGAGTAWDREADIRSLLKGDSA